MHAKATFVFFTTLILYIITLATVSYVGVYLTYIAIPLIVLSGLIMLCTKPKPEHQEVIDETKEALTEISDGFKYMKSSMDQSLNEYMNSPEYLKKKAKSEKIKKLLK